MKKILLSIILIFTITLTSCDSIENNQDQDQDHLSIDSTRIDTSDMKLVSQVDLIEFDPDLATYLEKTEVKEESIYDISSKDALLLMKEDDKLQLLYDDKGIKIFFLGYIPEYKENNILSGRIKFILAIDFDGNIEYRPGLSSSTTANMDGSVMLSDLFVEIPQEKLVLAHLDIYNHPDTNPDRIVDFDNIKVNLQIFTNKLPSEDVIDLIFKIDPNKNEDTLQYSYSNIS